MSQESSQFEALIKALRHEKLDVEDVAGTINIASGRGLTAVKANIDPAPLLERLAAQQGEGASPHRTRQLIAGFVSGVSLSMREPKSSRAGAQSYEQLAGGMLLNLEVDTFSLGVKAVHGVAPWSAPFVPEEEIIQVVYLSINRGMRPLTLDQVERWGATDDRIYSAARSMLFHKTRDGFLDPATGLNGEPHDTIKEVRFGDGYEAARSMVLTEVFYAELDEPSFRFAIPSPSTLLFASARGDDAARHMAELEELAKARFAEAEYPLSPHLHELETLARPMRAHMIKTP